MLQQASMCNLKFSCITALTKCRIGIRGKGLWMSVCRALGRETRSGSRLTRRACPPSQKDVDQQQDRQNQADSEMNPTRPRTQSFAARVIKAVAGDGQNSECTQKHRAVCAVTGRAPCESHMTIQQHADQYQNRHRGRAMDLHRPAFCACFKIARRHSQIVPICPRDAAEKKQRYHGVEKISLQVLQSNRVWSRVSHGE